MRAFPPSEVSLREAFHVGQDLPPLGVQSVQELLEGHLLALGTHCGLARGGLADWQVAVGELLEKVHWLPPRRPKEVRQHLAGRPLPRRVGPVHVRLHPLELVCHIPPRRVGFRPEFFHRRVHHDDLLLYRIFARLSKPPLQPRSCSWRAFSVGNNS